MRLLMVVFLTLILGASAQNGCNVHEFYGLAWTWHNPSERHQNLLRWLFHNGSKCNKEQLTIIWNNLPEWAGTADSAEIRHKIIALYSVLAAKDSK